MNSMMKTKRILSYIVLVSVLLLLAVTQGFAAEEVPLLTPQEQLGKSIFFDKNLSINQNQSCASCHQPDTGWTGPDSQINAHGAVYEGSIAGRFGNRKPPTSAYATFSPVLHIVNEAGEALFVGGNFWDGRATGEKLGNPAADQAQGPFLNPVEQALPDSACVVYRVCNPAAADDYPVAFQDLFGAEACNIAWPSDIGDVCTMEGTTVNLSSADRAKSDDAYDNIGLTIANYEASPEVNAFTSKFDYYLDGKAMLTGQEQTGLELFQGKALCADCHTLEPSANGKPLFTDFTFDNLGTPINPENPVYNVDPNFIDLGLGGFLATRSDYASLAQENNGKQKVPTLRNVDKRPNKNFVKAYMHNGVFKSLEEVVHFYNTRDTLPTCTGDRKDKPGKNCWSAPEVAENVNTDELGNLGLTNGEENAIVAFMKTLTDGYQPKGQGQGINDLQAANVEGLANATNAGLEQQIFLPMVTIGAQ